MTSSVLTTWLRTSWPQSLTTSTSSLAILLPSTRSVSSRILLMVSWCTIGRIIETLNLVLSLITNSCFSFAENVSGGSWSRRNRTESCCVAWKSYCKKPGGYCLGYIFEIYIINQIFYGKIVCVHLLLIAIVIHSSLTIDSINASMTSILLITSYPCSVANKRLFQFYSVCSSHTLRKSEVTWMTVLRD